MLKIGNLTKIGQTHFVCATDWWGETNVPHLQWHGRRSEIIPHNDRGIAMHMARFDVKFRQGLQQEEKK